MKNRLLIALIVGQGILIACLTVYLLIRLKNKEPQTAERNPLTPTALAQTESKPTKTEATDSQGSESAEPTLEDALKIARDGLQQLETNLVDYTARLVKRERVKGKLLDPGEIEIKLQERLEKDGKLQRPMRVYLKFTKPSSVSGREVIWEEDKRDGKLVAHEPGLLNVAQAWLEPTGSMAMADNLYPIYEIGIMNLTRQLIKRGEQDFRDAKLKVRFSDNVMVGNRSCKQIRIEQLQRREGLDFQVAEICIDMQDNIPVRYAAYGWPEAADEAPPLLEEYKYLDVQLNVGLSDSDFDPANKDYNYPSLKVNL